MPFGFLLLLAACGLISPVLPPGEGEKAERVYGACQTIIEALEAFHQANGDDPATPAG